MNETKRPALALIVLDGFGCREESTWNAIATASKPRFDALFAGSPWTTLEASGLAVGLPQGQMGNSEVGHLNLGAGRVVDQDIVRISKAVDSGAFPSNETLRNLTQNAGHVHLVGLLSDGGVHSLQHHLHGLIAAIDAISPAAIHVHAILDGRDTSPKSAERYVQQLLTFIADKPRVNLSTMIGRYFTMDRDKRWERVQRGYDLLTLGVGTQTQEPLETIRRSYAQGVTDEFIEPIAVLDESGAHHGRMEDGDSVIFFNFRADRMRQIVTALKDDTFEGFERSVHPRLKLASMNRYREDWDLPVLFAPQVVTNNLGEVLSRAGLTQLRIAETEKYAHVTFFFNGGSDTEFDGEDRVLVQSPKVATYDQKPAMSVVDLADEVIAAVVSGQYDVIILNIANPDMVGHTGVMAAAVEAITDTDTAVGRILDAVAAVGGVALITADHGNAELMFDDATGQPHTAHTTNPVPLILVDPQRRFGHLRNGGALENVAPTILEILGIQKPAEMTAESLLVTDEDSV